MKFFKFIRNQSPGIQILIRTRVKIVVSFKNKKSPKIASGFLNHLNTSTV
jgi:hypothetical protein